jgi:serine protease Do
MGLDQARGAMVAGVNEGSPAAEVGIKVGDIILRFADRKIDDVRELARAVAEHPVGKTAEVIVWRDGQRVELSPKIALLRQASPQVAQRQQGESHGADETGKLGMTLAPLTTQQRQVLGLAESVRGAMITGIEAGGAAAREGVRPGDVITRVGNKPIDSPSAVVEAIRDARANDKQSVAILLQRGEQKRFVALPLATERG